MSHASSGRPAIIDLTMESPSKQPTKKLAARKPTKKLVEPPAKAPTKKLAKLRAEKQKQAEARKAKTKQDLIEQLEKAKEEYITWEVQKAKAEAEAPVYVPGMAFEEYVTAQQTQFDTFQGVYKRAKVEGGRTLDWLRMFQAEELGFQKLKNLCAHQLRGTKASAWSPLLLFGSGKVDKVRSLSIASTDVVQQVEAILHQQEVYARCDMQGYKVGNVVLLRTIVGGQ